MSSDENDSNILVDTKIDTNRDLYLDIDIPKELYHKYRNVSTENRNLLHIWSHQFLFKAIKNMDFYLFKEIIENIIEDMSKEQTSHSICFNSINFFNPTLGDTYLNIVRRNGLRQFEQFLLDKVKFNKMNETHNSSTHFVTESDHVDMLAVFLEEARNLAVNLDISLHIAVRRNDLICAYMLLSKGAHADISDDGDITALHLAVLKGNVDMVRLILMASRQPLDIDSYRDYDNRAMRELIHDLPGLSFHSNFFEDLQIPPIKEQTLKFFFNNCGETVCLKVMKEGFHSELSHDVAEELLNIAIRRNYCKIVQDILGKFNESPISLNVVKNTAVVHGNHVVLRKLLKLQPEITNDLFMNAYLLLKISSQDINMTDRLKCLSLILEQNKVHCNDDVETIFEMSKLQPHDDMMMKLNFFEIMEDWDTMEVIPVKNYLQRLNYFCIQCCNLCRLCRPKKPLIYDMSRYLIPESREIMVADRVTIVELREKLIFIGQEIDRNDGNSGKHVDLLASILEEITTRNYFYLATVLNNILHKAVRKNDLIYTYMLLRKGASASDPNIQDMTALHLAARNGNVDMVRLILMANEQPPDIDSYRDDNNRTTREVIQNLPELSFHSNFFEDLQIPPIKEQTLKFFLNNSDETKCLKVIKEGFFGELSLEVAEKLLSIAMRRNYYKIIQEILEKINENPISLDKDKRKAVLCGNHDILRVLFKLRPQVTNDLILYACQQLKRPQREINNQLECLKLILEQEHVDVRCTDDLDNTPLHYALEANNYEAAILLLKQGSYLGHMNKSKNIAIANIPAFVLFSYFNDCIQYKNEWTDECTIEFDYRCLMPHDDLKEQQETYQTTREMEVISYIANNDTLKHLLKHPLLSSFLYIKWYRMRYVLYANFVFYMTFYFFLNSYILNMTYASPSKSGKQITNDSFDTVFANTLQSTCSQDIFLWAFIMGMLLLFICQELLQFVFSPLHYLTDLKNWSQILLIVLTLTLLCGAGFQIGVLVILLSTWELITLISLNLLPSIFITIEMFQTVFFNFVRFFFPYMFLVLAFALVFHMLFTNDIHFSNPDLSLFKTIIMLTGEFDANNISFSMYPIWSRLVFVLFIFNIVIVLLNLLNGLAVCNILNIRNKSEILRLISQINQIVYFERIIIGKPFCWNSQWTWWNPFNYLSRRIFLFPYFLRNGKMSFKPYNNPIIYDSDIYFDDKSNGLLQSMDYYKLWSTLKMDPNIIKTAKQIAFDKNNPSNDNIMDEFAKIQTKLMQVKVSLKCAE